MARTRKSHGRDEEEVKRGGSGLAPAYRSAGANPYVIYADCGKGDPLVRRLLILNFAAKYSAKYMLDQLIGQDEWSWIKDIGSRKCLLTSSDVRISMFGDDLEMLLNYKATALESEWEDETLVRRVHQLKYGGSRVLLKTGSSLGEERLDNRVDKGETTRRAKREKKEPRVKIDKTGMVSANDIASELGVEGREVRGVLRAMKLEKPQGGWLFDKKTADDIREKVKKGLKAAKKGKKK